ncbi:MAG: ECF transporter S component [Candidatus Bathyarchaeia archaeon]
MKNSFRQVALLNFLASILAIVSTGLGIVNALGDLGVISIFEKVVLSSAHAINLALYATLGAMAVLLVSLATYATWKGLSKFGFAFSLGAIFLVILTLAFPFQFGFSASYIASVCGALSIVFLALGSVRMLKIPSKPLTRRPLSSVEVSLIATLSALTAAVTAMTGQFLPSPTGGYTHIGDSVIYIASLLLGPKDGALIGILGALGADFYVAYPRWFVSIPAHGIQGVLAGLGRGRSFPLQLALCALGGFFMASTYFYVNIFIKGLGPALISYARDLFGQTGFSIAVTAFVFPPLKKVLPRLKVFQLS